MRCENHPALEGNLAVDLPIIGVKRYLCAEGADAIVHNLTQYKGKREAWEFSPVQYELATDGRLIYPEMQGLQRNYQDER